MKTNRNRPLATAAFVLAIAAPSVQAITYYWDQNGTTTGFGTATGTWTDPTVSRWSTSSAGTGTPGASITTTTGDALNFGTDATGGGLATGTITVTGTVNAASLRFGSQTTGAVTLSGGTINLGSATSIHVGAGTSTVHTIASNITGAGTSLTKTGNTLQLSGSNSFTGLTDLTAGTIILGSVDALGGNNPGVNGTSSISMATGTTLRSSFVGATVHAPITTAGSVTLGAPTNTSGQTFSETIFNGGIGGTGNVTFRSYQNLNTIQTVTLGAANTYSGTTLITTNATTGSNTAFQIVVKLGVDNALPTTTVATIDGGLGTGSGRVAEINLFGFDQQLAGLTNVERAARVQRVVNSSASDAATLTINGAGDSTFTGFLGGGTNFSVSATTIPGSTNGNNFGLTKNGTGTFTISPTTLTAGTATYSGNTFNGPTKVLGGILVLGTSNAMLNSPLDTAASIAGDATNGLRTTVTAVTMGGLTGNKNLADVFTTTSGGYTGLTDLTLNPVSGASHSYSGDIGDGATGMNLNKTGAGTQILTGTITHTGSTTVSAGVLAVNGTLANTSTTTVSGTGTLKGSGVINSSVTINSGGTLASGNSIESLAIDGNLSFTTGSNIQYELDADQTEQGDLTAVTGSLSLTGTVTLNLLETGSGSWELGSPLGDHFGSPVADKLTLISYNGTWNGGLFTYLGNTVADDSGIIINGQQWWFNYNDTDAGSNFTGDLGGATRFVTITVPEPAAALLGGIGLLMLLRRRRN